MVFKEDKYQDLRHLHKEIIRLHVHTLIVFAAIVSKHRSELT